MNRMLLCLALLCAGFSAVAQDTPGRTPAYWSVDLALGAGEDVVGAWGSLHRMHPIGKRGKLRLGYGLRVSGTSVSDGGEFLTAPAKLTSGESGPQVLFLDDMEENIDTLTLTSSATFVAVNAAGYIEYHFNDRWALGFNIDVVGFTFGSETAAAFVSQLRPGPATAETGKPTGFNALLISDNDRGSLNSEFYVRYALNERWALRAGFSFLFNEITTDRELVLDNDRFRKKGGLGFVAVNFRPWN